MNFDEITDRRGTRSSKWDGMAAFTGVTAPDALAMWIADMDFAAPDFLQDAVRGMLETGNYGYFVGMDEMYEAVCWWMRTRHGWDAQPGWILPTYGLGNGIAICIQAFSDPGDAVAFFTPVYHEFTSKVRKSGREVRELPLVIRDGVYHMDFDDYDARMTGSEKVLLLCSPHNPAGRLWTRDELRAVADFCKRHDLVLISDEIHHDLVNPGQTHIPLPLAAPEAVARTVMLTSSSKTFNTAGSRLGCVIIRDEALRARFAAMYRALDINPNLLGARLTQAAYSPAGAEYVDALRAYIAENQRVFMDGIGALPGLRVMPMQSTYLAWVDFDGTGMDMAEVLRRAREEARIAPSVGADFGTGGESFLRFNLGTQRARVTEAVARMQAAFSDLQ